MDMTYKSRKCPECRRWLVRVKHKHYDWECPGCGNIIKDEFEKQLEASGMRDELPPQGREPKMVRESAVDAARKEVDERMPDGEDKDQVLARLRVLRRHPPKVTNYGTIDCVPFVLKIERKF